MSDNAGANVPNKQLSKYAEDLARVYQSEKRKRKELQEANKELQQIADQLNRSNEALNAANLALQTSYADTIQRLVIAAEYRDEETGNHILRMSRYCALIAEKHGFDQENTAAILLAASMHDVGKIGIPDAILLKKGRLSKGEFEIIKSHTTIGARILGESKALVLQWAGQIALFHHEKWNGLGYPKGLGGTTIPLVGRIAAIGDVFDALTSRRPYKEPFPAEMAFEIIEQDRGVHFDPDLARLFLKHRDEVMRIKEEIG